MRWLGSGINSDFDHGKTRLSRGLQKTAIRPTTSSDARNSKQAADRRGVAGLLIGGGGG